MRRRILGALLLGAFACRPQESPSGHVVVVPPPASAPSASASVVVAAPTAPPTPAVTFSVVGRFAPGVSTHAYGLGSSVAIVQSNEHGSSVTAVNASKRRVDLSTKLGPKNRSPNVQVLFVGGTAPDDAWISLLNEEAFPALKMDTWHVTGAAPSRASKRYVAMGALRADQWVALPAVQAPMYLYDHGPSKLESLRGTGTLPTVPADVHLMTAAFLGNGSVCGLGMVDHPDAGMATVALWLAKPDGSSHTFSLGTFEDPSSMSVLRGPDGECVVVTPGNGSTSFGRPRGDALVSVTVDRETSAVSSSPSGAIWFYDHAGKVMCRTDLSKDPAVVKLPGGLPDCTEIAGVASVVALADDDVWITASCSGKTEGDVLLHTEPRGNVDAWPAP